MSDIQGDQSGSDRRPGTPAHSNSTHGTNHGPGGATTWGSAPIPFVTDPYPSPPTVPFAGIRTGEIIGHRLWWIHKVENEPVLCSLAHKRLWEVGETVEGNVNKPVDGMIIFFLIWGGVYAFREHGIHLSVEINHCTGILRTVTTRRLIHPASGPEAEAFGFVKGTIKMWGAVIEHRDGYRSSHAKLETIDEAWGEFDVERIRKKYLP